MKIFTILSWLLRWLILWPFVVVSAFNIENAITESWLSNVLADNAGKLPTIIANMYATITAPWLAYPLLFIGGIITWDTVYYICRRLDRPNSCFSKFALRNKARQASMAFRKKGWMRRFFTSTGALQDVNERLANVGLPLLPSDFSGSDEMNGVVAEYAELIALGKEKTATVYLSSALTNISYPQGTNEQGP